MHTVHDFDNRIINFSINNLINVKVVFNVSTFAVEMRSR